MGDPCKTMGDHRLGPSVAQPINTMAQPVPPKAQLWPARAQPGPAVARVRGLEGEGGRPVLRPVSRQFCPYLHELRFINETLRF